jgi:diguanylate cyclase (GGDEF)-like protein
MPESRAPIGPPTEEAVRAAHAEEMRASTRTTGLAGGALILVAMPLWALYDRVAAPGLAERFLLLRLAVLVPIAVCWLLLLKRPFGERHAEPLAFTIGVLPQVAVAWMLPTVGPTFEGYLLGYTLVLLGCALVLVGRLWLTVSMLVCTWAALVVSYSVQADGIDDLQVTTLVFYLGTATVLAGIGRYYRMRLERREVAARLALEAEQARTLLLVEELDRLSHEDSLTGVANRRAWDEALERACREADRSDRPLAVLLLDIDRFKKINDEHGHRRGDEVLQEVASRLAARIRARDLLARVGGDEFAVLCPNTGPDAARHLAEHLGDLVASMSGDLSVSVGWAVRMSDAGPDALMGLADRRLYQTKRRRITTPTS